MQSHSPRYTLAGEAPPISVDTPAWQARMLDTFVAAEDGALRFPEDADAVLALLEAGARAGQWAGVLRLARGADAAATAGGRSARGVGWWTMPSPPVARWGSGSHRLGAPQQGSRALCLGDRVLAADALGQALELRERLGDAEGAATTRHNLAQLGGGAAPLSPNGGPKPPRPRWPWFAGVVAVLAAGIVVAALIAGGGSNESAPAADSTSLPTAATDPAAPGGRQTTRAPQIRTPDRVGARPAPVAVSRRRPARRASRPRRYHSARSRSGRPATPRSSTPRTPRPTAPPSAESRSAASTPAISPSPGTSAGIARCRPMPSAPWP